MKQCIRTYVPCDRCTSSPTTVHGFDFPQFGDMTISRGGQGPAYHPEQSVSHGQYQRNSMHNRSSFRCFARSTATLALSSRMTQQPERSSSHRWLARQRQAGKTIDHATPESQPPITRPLEKQRRFVPPSAVASTRSSMAQRRSYRAGVEHDAHHGAEALGWEVVLELCSYDARVACATFSVSLLLLLDALVAVCVM